ncbi:MAG: radical SAM protein [Candidatus Azobacteroides sp.]|nr:radical SAM protein [Candidatus Azobacteroides sp.]
MKNIYGLLKLNRYIHNTHIKCFGIYCLHLFRKRYLGIFIDPVLACNLRCKMCYFSDPEKRKTMKGKFAESDFPLLAKSLFHRALKLQIGCGAEPMIHSYNMELIKLGKKYNIPYISMTTNANLLSDDNLRELVEAGLNEITLSVHGVTKETYEYFMENASFEKFHNALSVLTEIKNKYPDFKIRLNYTVNRDNLDELKDFFRVFGGYKFNLLQIRPIQKMGDTIYDNFSWHEIIDKYDSIIQPLKKGCMEKGITCLAPEKKDLTEEGTFTDNSTVVESTYCYISPRYIWKNDFNFSTDTYETYSKRTKLGKKLFANIFRNTDKEKKDKKTLNYNVT